MPGNAKSDECADLGAQLFALGVVEIGHPQDVDLIVLDCDDERVDDADDARVAELDELVGDASLEPVGGGESDGQDLDGSECHAASPLVCAGSAVSSPAGPSGLVSRRCHPTQPAAAPPPAPGRPRPCTLRSMPEPEKDVVTWEDLERLVADLSEQLAAGPPPDVVLAISRGGLVPAGMLGYRLGWRDMLLAAVVVYDDEHGFRGHAEFLQFPPDELLRGKRVVIIDEVWDSGTTIAAVHERVRSAGGQPVTAVLHYKPGRSRSTSSPDHFVVETDAWVVYPFKAGK